ncbi:DUF4880 domain-containing protein [Cellvibrio sp. KB43]|uniref:DUF4880 domain-containing protein n=2 Tax=Cellvibrio polysaccharolyticus TaxID=2082724 RepID=A0A928V3R6_9GAMM|nr:DUF4880 domain-containing protein [Cellvibrio polysaccharolyticus]
MNMAATSQQQLLEETAEWFVRVQERPLSAREQQAFHHWQARSPAHRAAWQRVENLLARLDSVPAGLAMPALDRPVDEERRALLTRMAILVLAVPVSGAVVWQLSEQNFLRSDLYTGKGERKTQQLADGSTLWLNASSAATLNISDTTRAVHLLEGELTVQVMRASQPLLLSTAEGFCKVYENALIAIRLANKVTCVDVLEGQAYVQLAARATPVDLQSGQSLRFSATDILEQSPVNPAHSSWRFGMLVADSMRLADVVAGLQGYRRGRIDVQPELADLLISGSFPLDDLNKTFQMLADTYQLRISEHWLGYRVMIAADV